MLKKEIVLAAVIAMCAYPAHAQSSQDTAAIRTQIQRALNDRQYATAVPLLRTLADGGDSWALGALGAAYLKGEGVERNPIEAARLLRLSADKGDKHSQYYFGMMNKNGEGIGKNPATAYRYLLMAAKQGVTAAQFYLGTMLDPGPKEGVPATITITGAGGVRPFGGAGTDERIPKDPSAAAYWYMRAAENGLPDAQVNVAISYRDGRGVPQNASTAAQFFRLAALQGDESGQGGLAQAYFEGAGLPKDRQRAYMWASLAASSGDAMRVRNRDLVASTLSSTQRARGEQMAAECLASHFSKCDP